MSEYIEFKGRTLNEAIAEACAFYSAEREKLEIEIVNDAKSGIFGLVGAKKATIRARRAQVPTMDAKELASLARSRGKEESQAPKPVKNHAEKKNQPEKKQEQAEQPGAPEKTPEEPAHARNGTGKPAGNQRKEKPEPREKADKDAERHSRGQRNKPAGKPRPVSKEPAKQEEVYGDAVLDPSEAEEQASFSGVSPESLNQNELREVVLEAVRKMAEGIVGPEATYEIEFGRDRIFVLISQVENPGLLIGRDGQTLSALQYLASCIVSRRMQASLRVQIDAGDYRERQNDKLRELALELSAKVKESGKAQSTKPMSAYQRRVVHLVLQDDAEVQTHSKGEGSLKRVVIAPKRK